MEKSKDELYEIPVTGLSYEKSKFGDYLETPPYNSGNFVQFCIIVNVASE